MLTLNDIMKIPKINKWIVLIGIIVLALIIFNLLIIFGAFDDRNCIEVQGPEGEKYNVYVCGQEDPVQEIKDVILNSQHIDIVFESDLEKTQKGSYIAKGIISFADQLAAHDLSFYGISLQDGNPVKCTGGDNSINYTLEQCLNLKPTVHSALIYVNYPHGGSRSELEIKGRTVYFKSATAMHLQNLVDLVLVNVLYYA